MTDEEGFLTSDGKAMLLSEVLKNVAAVPGPSTFTAVFEKAYAAMGVSRECAAGDIHSSVYLLAKGGLIECSGYVPGEETLALGDGVMLTPSKTLTHFIWSEDEEGGAA